jgi:hypothetical protein
MKKIHTSIVLIVLFGISFLGFFACKSDNLPGEKEAFLILEEHFRKEIYKGYVEVLDVKMLSSLQDEYMGGKYYDMQVEAQILVKKGHVISKLYTISSFDVNEQWAEDLENSLKAAESAEDKKNLIELFEANTFSEGEHTIMATFGYALLDERWHLLNLSMAPL